MKRSKIIVCLIIIVMIVGKMNFNTVHAWWVEPWTIDSTPAYWDGNPYSATYVDDDGKYHNGNCTWYCWGRANHKLGIKLPGWNGPGTWYNLARNAGYEVGTQPKTNSIIVWQGHVAFVESWDGSNLIVSECNWNPGNNPNAHSYNERTCNNYNVGPGGVGQFIGFIYLEDDKDTINPVISKTFVDPTSMNGSQYTVYVEASDNVGISKIPVMTWSKENGQDDIKEYRAISSNGYYKATIKASDHGSNKGLYRSDVYVYDEDGNGVVERLDNIPMGSKLVTSLGDFTARIVPKNNTNYAITTNGTSQNSNVMLGNKSNSDEGQIWKFMKRSDGKSYEIVNIASGRALDITNAKDTDGANVAIYTRNNSNAQIFYIMEYNGGYRIVPKCSSNLKAIDLYSGTVNAGQNIDLYNVCTTENSAQTWIFEEPVTIPDNYKIKLNFKEYQLNNLNETITLQDEYLFSDMITWTSTNEKIAIVENGKVIPKSGGFVHIKAETEQYGEDDCWIYVCALRTLSDGNKAYPGDLNRNGTFEANDAAMILDLYNKTGITEDEIILGDLTGDGVVNANDAAVVLDIYKYNTFTPGKYNPITKISLNTRNMVLNEGEKQKLEPIIVPEDTTDSTKVTWSSNNSYIAKVDENGYVTSISGGTAIITATSSNGLTVDCEVISNAPIRTQNISGKITSYGDESEELKLELIKKEDNTILTSKILKGNLVSYNFDNIPTGNYILRVSKANHVTREYEITENDSSLIQDITIFQIGDVNGDGKVTLLDYGLVLAHVKRTKLLTGESLTRADVNGDNKVTLLDYGLILAHVKRTKLLF